MKLILSFLCLGVFCLTSSVFAQNPSSFPTSEDAISGVQEDTLDEEIQNSNISYKVIGISGDLRDNVDAYLSTLPDIKKVNFYSQQENIEQKINTALAVFGYYHVKTHYQFASEKSTTLIINVDAGKPVWIRKVDVVVLGEAMTDPRYMFMFRKLTLKSHTIFKHSVYEDLKSTMMSRALTMGFFDAHFVVSKAYVNVDENFADIFLVLNSEKGYVYDDLKFSGDVKYKTIIDPVINIQKGERFNMTNLSQLSSNLYDTGYFSNAEVSPDLENIHDNIVPISVNLQRKKFNIVELGLGYATDERTRGRVKWNMPLINDYGHSIQMQLDVSSITQEALFKYTIPRKNPLLDYYYLLAQQSYDNLNDTDSTISSYQFHYVAKDTGSWTRDYGFTVQLEDYTQGIDSGFDLVIGPRVVLNKMTSSPRADLHQGAHYNLKIFGSDKSFGADVSFLQLYGMGKWLFSPTTNSRFLFRLEQGVNIGHDANKLPPSFRFFTGGDSTIRGFSYKSLSSKDKSGKLAGGKYLSVGSMELQIPVFEKMRNSWFVDAGSATNDYSNHDDFYVGVGTGIRYISPVGLIKFDIGFGVSETSIPFHLHFGIGPDL
jgi:translocation and assembly module TamA